MRRTAKDIFLSDKKEQLGSLFSVRYDAVKYPAYEVRTVPEITRIIHLPGQVEGRSISQKNVEVVCGVGRPIKNDRPFLLLGQPIDVIHRTALTKQVFFEVMNLVRKLDVKAWFDEETCQAIPTEGILALCRKYGISSNVESPLWLQHRIAGFELRNFKYRLFKLHWRFSAYMAYWNEDYNLLRELLPWRTTLPEEELRNQKRVVEFAKEFLTEEGAINFELVPTAEGFALEAIAQDIIHACHIFLSLMVLVKEGRNIKVCLNPKCQAFFTGRGKYCPNCDRRTVWSQRKREEERKMKLVKIDLEGARNNG